jgi:hypothetical protein
MSTEVTKSDLEQLNKITLTKTQLFGFNVLKERVTLARQNATDFIMDCLEENGGSINEKWNWDDDTMEWTLNE